jgi:hypothetical protein
VVALTLTEASWRREVTMAKGKGIGKQIHPPQSPGTGSLGPYDPAKPPGTNGASPKK